MRRGTAWGSAILLCATILASAQSDVIKLNGGRTVIHLGNGAENFTASQRPNAKLTTIYSDLGTGKAVYNGSVGTGVLGTQAGQPWPEAVGNGFRPKADYMVTEIDVAAAWVQGHNSIVLSLRDNAKGDMPGKILRSWTFQNLPQFGTCCTLQVGKYAKGIPVKKGKLYWVVLDVQKQFQDTYDVWDNNIYNRQGAFSNNIGSGWTQKSTQTLGGFAVYGK